MRAAKQGLHEVIGARGELLVVAPLADSVKTGAGRLTFEPATTTLSEPLCPRAFLTALDEAYAQVAADLGEAYSDAHPELRITTDVQFFEEKGLLDAAQVLVRVKVYNGASSSADVLVRVVSESFRAGGKRALADEVAKTLAKMLRRKKTPSADS
jgi:hypothetical protein